MASCHLSPTMKVNLKNYMGWLQNNATDSNLINEAKIVEENAEKINICNGGSSADGASSTSEKKPQASGRGKPTTHRNFNSYCMRGEKKDGLGKSMSDCAVMWRGMSDEEKVKFAPQ